MTPASTSPEQPAAAPVAKARTPAELLQQMKEQQAGRPPKPRKPNFKQSSAKIIRWLHIYASLFSCAIVLFFSVTGITLNHPTWFGGNAEHVSESKGELQKAWVATGAGDDKIARLEIVEHLRKEHGARGAVSDLSVDDSQVIVAFRAPGYSADAFIQRDSGSYDFTQTSYGLMAVFNDLHKGRDSGKAWAWVIDISAGFLVLVSLTGVLLLLYINRHRRTGLITGAVGFVVCVAIFYAMVPH